MCYSKNVFRNNDTIIVAKENNALATYALIPCKVY